jgi:glucose-1-phosphate thymidylyltransferase
MKGILLAGGTGSRLWPITKIVNKHLLAVYDKPMIYYSLSTLILCGARDILLISTPSDLEQFEHLLGDGSSFGIKISYAVQNRPEGIAQAFIISEDFIGDSDVVLVLGDNIFFGNGLIDKLKLAQNNLKNNNSTIFTYQVNDPNRFGVAEINDFGKVISIEEKPTKPKSNHAVTGLYFYTNKVVNIAKGLKPSLRGELEITDINSSFLKLGELNSVFLGRGYAWLDTGTQESLLDAASFVYTLEKRQGYKISVPEEISYRLGYINKEKLLTLAENYGASPYGLYLKKIAEEKNNLVEK